MHFSSKRKPIPRVKKASPPFLEKTADGYLPEISSYRMFQKFLIIKHTIKIFFFNTVIYIRVSVNSEEFPLFFCQPLCFLQCGG